MKCPQCKHRVPNDVTSCPHCGYGLLIHQSFHQIKDDLHGMSEETRSLSQRLDQLQKQLADFEFLIAKRMEEEKPVSQIEEQKKRARTAFHGTETTAQRMKAKGYTPPQEQPTTSPSVPVSPEAKPVKAGTSEITVGQKWLLIAGVVLTVLAVGWFLKYSFDQNWIGPAGRVAMAYAGGMVLLGCGELFRKKALHTFGLYLIGGGVATLYFATFAAFQIYHLVSQVPAFGTMVLVTVLACALSLAYDTKWLAVLGLIGGFLTPVILSTGVDKQVVLMTYMTILNVGILSLAFFRQWRLLNYLGFFLTWLLFSGWYFQYYGDHKFWITTIFLNIFFLAYAFAPFAYHVMREHTKQVRGMEIIVPNSFIAFGYSFAMIKVHFRVEYVSIMTLIYAIIFLWMAQVVYSRNREQVGALVMLIGKAILFMVLTIPILFSKHWITFFWAIQAVVLLWAALKLKNRLLYGSFVILSIVTLGKFFFYDYGEVFRLSVWGAYFQDGYASLLIERLVTSAVVIIAALQSARLVAKAAAGTDLLGGKDKAACWGVFAVVLFLVLNVEVGAFFYDYALQARFAATSVLWALFSIVMMVFGFVKNRPSLRICAIGLFAVTMIKVFAVDMSRVSTPYRIISFMVLGIMLIGASYLYYRFKKQLSPATSKEEPTQ